MAGAPTVSVVVPVYNGAATLPLLVQRIIAVSHASPSLTVTEVILVDDASADDSWAVIEQLAGEHPRVRGVALARNFGQHAALLAGIVDSTGDVVVTMDDDLQHLPEQIPALVAALGPGVDLVYGRPVVDEHGVVRNIASRAVKWGVSVISRSDVARLSSGFRAMRAPLRDGLHQQASFASLDVALSRLTNRVLAVPVVMQPRRHGRSNYTFGRLLHHALTMLFGFSDASRRLAASVGLGGHVARRYSGIPGRVAYVERARTAEGPAR